jgi:hypothetical protein
LGGEGQGIKKAPETGAFKTQIMPGSLDLGFLELDMLTDDRIILHKRKLVGLGPRVLLGHVKTAGIGGRQQLDLDGVCLGHGRRP